MTEYSLSQTMSNSEKLAGALCGGKGPVPFKDVTDADAGAGVDATPVFCPSEHGAATSTLPPRHVANYNLPPMVCYKGFWLNEPLAQGLLALEGSFAARPGDVVLASLPKAGTTWLKALAFATMARGAWPPSSQDHPLRRLNPHECVPTMETDQFAYGREALMDKLPSPRLIATHMPLSLLPSTIAGVDACCKIVYICRDEKDRTVSRWHFIKQVLPHMSLTELYESSCKGICIYGPVWDHILEYWKASNERPSKVLFMTYKNVLQDPCDAIRKLAQFLGQPFCKEEEEAGVVAEIHQLCSFDNLRKQEVNKECSQGRMIAKFSSDSFFRKGMVGDWVNYMTPEMGERLDAILHEKLDGSGLTI